MLMSIIPATCILALVPYLPPLKKGEAKPRCTVGSAGLLATEILREHLQAALLSGAFHYRPFKFWLIICSMRSAIGSIFPEAYRRKTNISIRRRHEAARIWPTNLLED
jgi:hypothetical protein